MLHDRVENFSAARGAAVRYMLSAVSKSTVQTTLATIAQFCDRSVENYRYALRCSVAAYLSSPTKERGLVMQHLITQALTSSNALTLVGTALDEAPIPMTEDTLASFMSTELKLSRYEQMQFAMALTLGGNKAAEVPASAFLKNFGVTSATSPPPQPSLSATPLQAHTQQQQQQQQQQDVQTAGYALLARHSHLGSIAADSHASFSTQLNRQVHGIIKLAPGAAATSTATTTTTSSSSITIGTAPHAATSSSSAAPASTFSSHARSAANSAAAAASSTTSALAPVPSKPVSLATVLRELGTGCVTTLSDSRELLNIFTHPFTEWDVAEVLGFFASQGTAVNDSNTYHSLMLALGQSTPRNVGGTSVVLNPMPLLDALHERAQFDWVKVIRLLDAPGEEPFRLKHISVIFDAYHKFKAGAEYPAITLFLGRWRNVGRQRVALEYILHHPDRVNRRALNISHSSSATLIAAAAGVSAPTNSSSSGSSLNDDNTTTTTTTNNTSIQLTTAELLSTIRPASVSTTEAELWRTHAFVEAVVHVASRDSEFDAAVLRPMLEKMPLLMLYMLLNHRYEGTVKGYVAVKHLLSRHCPPMEQIATHVMPALEKNGRLDSLIGVLSEWTMGTPTRVVDVLEMVLKHGKSTVRHFLKTSNSPRLVTGLAMCMDEAGEPSDKWLQKALEGKLHFRSSSTESRFVVAMSIVEVADMLLERQLYVASATAALNALMASPLKDILKSVTDYARSLLAATDSLFPEDVENEAMQLFKRMYADGHTGAAIATVERLLRSGDARDKQLYACTVSILFDEGSAISCYPRKELQLFAAFYGQMVARELLPPNQQQRAWGLLLPAIVKPTNYAVEEYGNIALEQIKPRLVDWPQYGRALRHIKDLDFRIPGIMAAIHRGIRADEAAKSRDGAAHRAAAAAAVDSTSASNNHNNNNSTTAADATATTTTTSSSSTNNNSEADMKQSVVAQLHTHNISTLLTNRKVTSPPKVIQEQINFLIGNTDVHNISDNARELGQLLRPEYYEYFADYLVVMRAALEPNYRTMYLDLVSKLQSKDLDLALRNATIAAVQRLIQSEKIQVDSNERFLLRNLGSWLGSITLERSIPILQLDLNFSELLQRGLREGKLIPIVSLITRVLNSCAKSRFFCPPNPWTMAQLCLLLEMYHLPHLKMTLRFEVELVCKHLEVTLESVADYMRQHYSSTTVKITASQVSLREIYCEINIHDSPDFRVDENGGSGLPDLLPTQPLSPVPPPTSASSSAQQQQESQLQALQLQQQQAHQQRLSPLQQQQQAQQQALSMPMSLSQPSGAAPLTTVASVGSLTSQSSPGSLVRGSVRPLQASAEPFQPREQQLLAAAAPAAPASAVDYAAMLASLDVPRRPAIVVTAETVRLGQEEQVIPPANVPEYRRLLAATLHGAVEELYANVVMRSVAVAVATAHSILLKDFARNPCAEELLLAAEATSRSLAVSLCFATAREELALSLRRTVQAFVNRIFVPETHAESNAELHSSIMDNNEELCMRALEYRAGEEAAKQLRIKLHDALYERLVAYGGGGHVGPNGSPVMLDEGNWRSSLSAHALGPDHHAIAGEIALLDESLQPAGRLPYAQREVYVDFFNCTPIVSQMSLSLRSVEESVSKYHSTENYVVLDVSSAQFMQENVNEHHILIRQRMSAVLCLITRETAVYYLSLVFNKLMNITMNIDAINKELALHNNTNNNGAAGSSGNGAEAAAAAAAAGGGGLENAQTTRTMHVATLLNQIYLVILQLCVSEGGDVVREEFTRLYLKHESRYLYAKLTTDLMRIRILHTARLDEDLAKELASGSSQCVSYAGEMIYSVIILKKLVTAKDMRRTLAVLDTISRSRTSQRPAPTSVPTPAHNSLPPLRTRVQPTTTQLVVPLPRPPEEMQNTVHALLNEWTSMWSRKIQHRSGSSHHSSSSTGHTTGGGSSAAGGTSPASASPSSSSASEDRNPSVDFVKTLQQHGMLDTSRLTIFLELSIRLCVEHYANVTLRMERECAQEEAAAAARRRDGEAVPEEEVTGSSVLVGSRPGAPPPYRLPHSTQPFIKCDGFVDLVLVLLRCCSLRNDVSREQRAETTLLRRVLDTFVRVLSSHHDCVASGDFPRDTLPAGTEYIPVFQQQPYVRLISNLMIMIQRQEATPHREISDEITLVFQGILHRLSPLDFPAFAFGWSELVAHRIFLPRCMRSAEMWSRYTELIVDGLRFIEVFSQGGAISPNALVFYKTIFKLMLVLLHDFPHFMISQHFMLCNAIPPHCVQLLNTVLCSFPPELHLPEPFEHIAHDWVDMLKPIDTTVQVECIRTIFLESVKDGFDAATLTRYVASNTEPIPEWVLRNVYDSVAECTRNRLMNAIVLHIAITYLEANNMTITPSMTTSNAMTVYRYLCQHLSAKQRYMFICACAIHLRYPNIQTNFFAKAIFTLFLPSASIDARTQTCIQEQITRVVAEKTVILQPHPWGVLNTFVELMRNPTFAFWEKSFINSPYLEQIFTKLRRTLATRNSTAQNSVQASAAALH